jgi:hypothetical protein
MTAPPQRLYIYSIAEEKLEVNLKFEMLQACGQAANKITGVT